MCVLIHIPNVYFYLKTYRLILKNVLSDTKTIASGYTIKLDKPHWSLELIFLFIQEYVSCVVYIDKMHVGMFLNKHISMNMHI